MKVTVTQAAPVEPRDITYPILMQHTSTGLIVLFSSSTSGIKVAGTVPLTYQLEINWNPTDNANSWRPFAGTIILQNDPEQLL